MYEYVFIIPSVIQPCWHYVMETKYKRPRLPGILLKRMTFQSKRMSIRKILGFFLDEYPWWGLGTSHQTIILYEMFLHAAKRGWKEVEHMVHQGCRGSMYDSDSEADQSAMELVGYHTS